MHSIRFRLSASYAILTLLTAGVIGAVTVNVVSHRLRAEEEAALRAQAAMLADQAFRHFLPAPSREALGELCRTSAAVSGVRVRILGPVHEPLADSRAAYGTVRGTTRGVGDAYLVSAARSLATGIAPTRRAALLADGRLPSTLPAALDRRAVPLATTGPDGGVRVVSVAAVGTAEPPLGYIELSRVSMVDVAGEAARRAALLAAAGATLIAMALGVLMGQGMTVGLRALSAAALSMGAGNLGTRARVRGRDEIARLGDGLNGMAAQLEASFAALAQERDTLRRFVVDASHELRTPLTALITFNELLRNAASADQNAREEFLAESQRQLERLEWITRSLLILSRLEAGLVEPELETCEADELLSRVCRTWASRAREAGVELRILTPASPLVHRCDRSRIEVALNNLLSNAVQYTPPGGVVTAAVERVDGRLRYWISDTGPGIPPEEQERVFDRFYRGVGARGAGSGLGLAIVKSVALLHRGRVTLDTRTGQGSVFRMDLPC